MPVDLDVGDAVVVNQAANDRPQLVQSAAPSIADAFGEFPPGGPHIACRVDEFVVSGACTFAPHIEQRLLGTRGAVPGEQMVDVVGIGCGKGHYCRTVLQRSARCGVVGKGLLSCADAEPQRWGAWASYGVLADWAVLTQQTASGVRDRSAPASPTPGPAQSRPAAVPRRDPTGIEDGVKGANRVAASTVKKQLAPSLTTTDIAEPMSEEASADLQRIVSGRILDGYTSTVRIWATDGTLIYSSTGEPTGTQGGNERGIRLATDGEGKTTSIVPASELGVLDIYTPLRLGGSRESSAAVELVQSYAPIFEAAGQPWNLVQSIAGGLAAIALVMTVVSFAFRRAGRFGKREGMGFARPGGSGDEEKLRRTIAARDEQLTQLRVQLMEQESENVERMRDLEMQLRETAARASRPRHVPATVPGSPKPRRKRTAAPRRCSIERCEPKAN